LECVMFSVYEGSKKLQVASFGLKPETCYS